MTISEAKQKLCMWAQLQIGTREDTNNWNKYAAMPNMERLYGGRIQNVPWCDVFTDAAFVSNFGIEQGAAITYQRIGGASALCRDSAQYFKENGAFSNQPEIGDVVFFYYDGDINHMGIVTRVSGVTITTVEGNTNGMVAEMTYNTDDSRIAGYGHPNWGLVAEKEGQRIMQGVDISRYQHGLTIEQLKNSGKSFAIIKLTEGNYLRDGSAFDFYLQAYNSGFPVGGYCYSHAMNAQQAMAEGAFLLDTIKRFPVPCGLFIDIEESSQLALSKEELLDVIRGWCASVGGAGYIPGVYSSEGTLWSKVRPEDIPDGCLVWVAKWSNNQPGIPCDIWQNSDSGRIDGYNGNVDTDVALSERFQRLVNTANYNREDKPPDHEEIKPTQNTGVKAAIMVLQLVMSYAGYWGEVTGEKSNEFFNALHTFVEALEKS